MMDILQFNDLQQRFSMLKPLADALSQTPSLEDKLQILNETDAVKSLSESINIGSFLNSFNGEKELIIKSIAAIGQAPLVFQGIDESDDPHQLLENLCKNLCPIEKFYTSIGGLVGYHTTVLDLLIKSQTPKTNSHTRFSSYLAPPAYDICSETSNVWNEIRKGIESLPQIAEIYPVGGAGDRLDLRDEATNEPLPSAELLFCGRTLLEGLIRDLQGREYVYYKLTGKQAKTPVVLMTSLEKKNSEKISGICQRKDWFGREEKDFYFIVQPLVPVVTIEGNWALSAPGDLILKPGGHGVIWKLAEDAGILSQLKAKGIKKILVRQINNPIAGLDYTFFAFTGVGIAEKKCFGFCSCPRLPKTAEGINTLVEKLTPDYAEYHISNIEYTDFVQMGIKDIPEANGSPYSAFPANTNILFADLAAVQKAIKICPIPGMLINMKNTVACLDVNGKRQSIRAGRLESLMQNLAEGMVDRFVQKLDHPSVKDFKTFLTNNTRQKTISVTKKTFKPGEPIVETPEGCFYDLLCNGHDLMHAHCGIEVPAMPDETSFINHGPSFIIHYHPALGPLYSVIAQKMRGGRLFSNSEVILEIAELDWDDVHIEGSLIILADSIMGGKNSNKRICYNENSGKCTLKNVHIRNSGIDYSAKNIFWKQKVKRKESLEIILHGNAEFFAENVHFDGKYRIEVPDGHRMVAYEENKTVRFSTAPIDSPTWHWSYSYEENDKIKLVKKI